MAIFITDYKKKMGVFFLKGMNTHYDDLTQNKKDFSEQELQTVL